MKCYPCGGEIPVVRKALVFSDHRGTMYAVSTDVMHTCDKAWLAAWREWNSGQRLEHPGPPYQPASPQSDPKGVDRG